jgi:tetratricopeptide (TPR) repeat protein
VIEQLTQLGRDILALASEDPGLPFQLMLVTLVSWQLLRARRSRSSSTAVERSVDSGEAEIQALIDANQYEQAGDIRSAQGEFEKALALYLNCGNDNKAALCYLSLKQPRKAAELYLRMGRLAEAAHYFQAVEDWLQAARCLDLAGSEREAAELYERAEQFGKAAEILERLEENENAALLYERAEEPAKAAEALLNACGDEAPAMRRVAALFKRAGEDRRAADCLALAGEWQAAAELYSSVHEHALAAPAFEKAELFDRAAAAYEGAGALAAARANFERAGEVLRAADIALRLGDMLGAGQGFYQMGQYDRALETLQGVEASSPQRRPATLLLGRIFLEKGLLDRAREKLESLNADPPASKDDLDILSCLAEVHEKSGEFLRALNLLEQISDFDSGWGDIEERLERLQERAWGGSSMATTSPFERYELRGELGRGGMGVVHLAQDRELERPVAIKFLPTDLASQPSAVRMFRQEARAAAAMNHPNVVQVYDVAMVGNRPCIVMEYVQGRTVRQLMRVEGTRERRPLSPRRVAEIARDICDALAYAHAQGVIHRDVKPGNIIVADRGHAKLMDFGISKVLEVGAEGQTEAKGTPQYMPPEQILGHEVDGRTDLYALGITMFEAVTSQRPFTGKDVVDKQLHSEMPDPRDIVSDVPQPLVWVIQRVCRKTPSDRFQSAREMADALTKFIELPPLGA